MTADGPLADAPGTPVLRLGGVTRRYGDVVAVDALDLEVAHGEVLAVVGPSGCGKTTLLQLVAGLSGLDAGTVELAGRLVTDTHGTFVPPERRRVGVVFQDHALFPHLTVAQNVEFGLADMRSRVDRARRRTEVLDLVRLGALADRYPHELSGGEQQRVALARALAPSPALLLFDEPFSSLDPNLRVELRRETAAVLRETGATAMFVTHDREEAMSIGDRVAVLDRGRLQQVATPAVVFHSPATRFVARFVGEADLLPGVARDRVAHTAAGPLALAGPATEGPVDVMVRPHEVTLAADGPIVAAVVDAEFRGALVQLTLRLEDGTVLHSDVAHSHAPRVGEHVRATIDAGHPLASFARAEPTAAPATALA